MLQSIIGVFLHACNSPETVQELLTHLGLSISTTSINKAVANVLKESRLGIWREGQKFGTMYAYDNLDIDLKQLVLTAENPQNTLMHLTTGTMIPLGHQITTGDLDCSDFLWKKHQNNLDARPQDLPQVTFEQLLELHPETIPPNGLHRRK